ncbi:hypothetical protein PGTUg99_025249 [Puccinia graminis f. sp. tritici]|uniref:Uncharacterized protein n=1 Tax=Puccinia graminis f. sp. tritici TaxID=56615 RepID=A0A5B0QS29_PUCGR|nr:hypothetical protein PGTUg99_025249 [Puccinia graminis f. sp. tritici]
MRPSICRIVVSVASSTISLPVCTLQLPIQPVTITPSLSVPKQHRRTGNSTKWPHRQSRCQSSSPPPQILTNKQPMIDTEQTQTQDQQEYQAVHPLAVAAAEDVFTMAQLLSIAGLDLTHSVISTGFKDNRRGFSHDA